MVRSNFVWCVVCLGAILGVPACLAAQELSEKNPVWIDLGFPLQERPDGSKVKPLFVPLITDLDGAIRQIESRPRAVWIPQRFFGTLTETVDASSGVLVGDRLFVGQSHLESVEAKRSSRAGSIERITIEGGEVEIIGDAVKIRGARVEILRNP